ncbi:hypothetical protein MTO96_032009 [Rhipicephalus appendiculatus]
MQPPLPFGARKNKRVGKKRECGAATSSATCHDGALVHATSLTPSSANQGARRAPVTTVTTADAYIVPPPHDLLLRQFPSSVLQGSKLERQSLSHLFALFSSWATLFWEVRRL